MLSHTIIFFRLVQQGEHESLWTLCFRSTTSGLPLKPSDRVILVFVAHDEEAIVVFQLVVGNGTLILMSGLRSDD